MSDNHIPITYRLEAPFDEADALNLGPQLRLIEDPRYRTELGEDVLRLVLTRSLAVIHETPNVLELINPESLAKVQACLAELGGE